MRHPYAAEIIALILGVLGVLWVWGLIAGGGHHEGNPHPDEVPLPRKEQSTVDDGEEKRTSRKED